MDLPDNQLINFSGNHPLSALNNNAEEVVLRLSMLSWNIPQLCCFGKSIRKLFSALLTSIKTKLVLKDKNYDTSHFSAFQAAL
jgi:hypothetical protein